MKRELCVAVLTMMLQACGLAQSQPTRDDIMQQIQSDSTALQPIVQKASELLDDGDREGATAMILAVFPEQTRTAVQSFVLANTLFKQEPKLSYALHKQAAIALPQFEETQYEWAMEQHRAREFAGALTPYDLYSQRHPNYAPALGLAAECALRLGKVDRALALWQASEKATSGSLDDFEDLVCEVNGPRSPGIERARLRKLVAAGDVTAAEALIYLDARWEIDWWNVPVQVEHLHADMAMIEHSLPADNRERLDAMRCATSCVIAGNDANAIRTTLVKTGFLLGNDARVPTSGKMATLMFGALTGHAGYKVEDARSKFAARVRELAVLGRDAEMWNVAANFAVGTKELAEVDLAGWDATHDARFAASYVAGLMGNPDVTLDTPAVAKARMEFPDDSDIAGIAVALASEEKRGMEPYLVAAILAEYRGFSHAPVVDRPKASALRAYFRELAKVRAAAANPAGAPPK